MFNEHIHTVQALAPDADALAGTVTTDVINMKNWGHIEFNLQKGVGATGTTVVTILACDDAVPSNTVAIPFKYRKCTSGDTFTALTAAAATGVTVSAGSNQQWRFEVEADALPEGYSYIQLQAVEGVDSPVDAAITAILTQPRYAASINATAIV